MTGRERLDRLAELEMRAASARKTHRAAANAKLSQCESEIIADLDAIEKARVAYVDYFVRNRGSLGDIFDAVKPLTPTKDPAR